MQADGATAPGLIADVGRIRLEKMKTYFTGEFAARRPVAICTGIVATLMGVAFAVAWLPQIVTTPWSPAYLFGTICAALFIGAPLSLGVFLLSKIVRDDRTRLSITSDGIQYGRRMFEWGDVEVFGIMTRYLGRRDLFCEVRSCPYRVELLVSKGLQDQDIASLFAALKCDVVSRHPNIQIVGGAK